MSSAAPESSATNEQVGFRGPKVCKIVGITYRQLDHWARKGFVEPSVSAAKGSGSQRLYSYQDVLELKLIKNLLDAGISLERTQRVIKQLRDDFEGDVTAATLLIDGQSVMVKTDSEIFDLIKGGQGVFSFVSMPNVKSQVDAAIIEFGVKAEPVAADTDAEYSVAN